VRTPFEDEIAKRMGALPNFFRLASSDPKIGSNLWGFAQFAYLDNPLPSLFKERLFVYLSRFCSVRYCIARHLGFLVGLGYPAGDSTCLPQKVEAVLPLLRRPLPKGEALVPLFRVLAGPGNSDYPFPEPDSAREQALLACATHVFLQTPEASRAHDALKLTLGAKSLEQLNLLVAFVRLAHYWTKLHPELGFEDDVRQLLKTHEALAECVFSDPEVPPDSLSQQVAEELTSLRNVRKRHEGIRHAYRELSLDHQYVQHTLRETEENLHELVLVMPAAVYACDRYGAITYCNQQAEAIWGRTPDVADAPWSFLDANQLYRSDGTLLPPEDAPVREVISTGVSILNREFVLERPDHSRIDVLANIAPLHDSTGEVTGAVSIFQDISERKRSELALRTSEKLASVGRMAATLAHEINNPLESVINLVYLAAQDQTVPETVRGYLRSADEELARIAHMTKQTLGLYRENTNAKPLLMSDMLRDLLAIFFPKAKSRGIEISLEASEQAETRGVQTELRQVFANLLTNSIDAVAQDGRIRIRVADAQEHSHLRNSGVRITIADNGVGIDSANLRNIFEPFFTTKTDVGTGLGLWISKEIVEKYKGSIKIRSSTRLGRSGTVASVFLPGEKKDRAVSQDPARSF
jgi:PAS domain S-box-containing protein